MKNLNNKEMANVTGGLLDWNDFADGVCDGAYLGSVIGGAMIAKAVIKVGARAIPGVGWVLAGIDAACFIRSFTQ